MDMIQPILHAIGIAVIISTSIWIHLRITRGEANPSDNMERILVMIFVLTAVAFFITQHI